MKHFMYKTDDGIAISILASRDYENFRNVTRDKSLKITSEELPKFEEIRYRTDFENKRSNSRRSFGDRGKPRRDGNKRFGDKSKSGRDRDKKFGSKKYGGGNYKRSGGKPQRYGGKGPSIKRQGNRNRGRR